MIRTGLVAAAIAVVGFTMAPAAAEPHLAGPTSGPGSGSEFPASPASQQNAVRKAQEYLAISAFSRTGLIEQLVYEGFTTADATFGVDSITVDWNLQAAQKAQEYLALSAFSQQGLAEQLLYEGFTSSQAAYGVAAAYQ